MAEGALRSALYRFPIINAEKVKPKEGKLFHCIQSNERRNNFPIAIVCLQFVSHEANKLAKYAP